MAKADVNKDGTEDIFMGGSKGHPAHIYLQSISGALQCHLSLLLKRIH